jgi:hypothetical protein
MAIWISTLVLVVVLAMIVRAELRSGRRSKIKLARTSQQIDDLAKVTFDRHREMFGKDATGTFPLADPAKK